MAFRSATSQLCCLAPALGLAAYLAAAPHVCLNAAAQVFVVGEKSAMADVSVDFHPTRVELPSAPITERGRRDLIRNLEAEQGFAHRALPLGDSLTLIANGNLSPGGDAYKQILYKKGESAQPGDRVAITKVTLEKDRIVFDINGGPYVSHRFLRHVELNGMAVVPDDGAQVTGCRLVLQFEGGLPEISAPEVKALLDPVIDFGVKTSAEAYADTLPQFLKDAIAQHDVLVGMNRKMVLAAMGAPQMKSRELMPGSTDKHYEEWIYGQAPQTMRFVRFVGDRVVQVRIAALGQPVAVHDKNELRGYLDSGDPDSTREIALGDKPQAGDDEAGRSAPPTILKQGEVAPGSSNRVRLPVAVPVQDKTAPPATGSAGAPAASSSSPPADTGSGAPATPAAAPTP